MGSTPGSPCPVKLLQEPHPDPSGNDQLLSLQVPKLFFPSLPSGVVLAEGRGGAGLESSGVASHLPHSGLSPELL